MFGADLRKADGFFDQADEAIFAIESQNRPNFPCKIKSGKFRRAGCLSLPVKRNILRLKISALRSLQTIKSSEG
jgi:hypothetical protein